MSAVKTKIGFDTKPYTVPPIKIYELFTISSKRWGKILLSIAILLSAIECIYLQSATVTKAQELKILKKEEQVIQKRYTQCVINYKRFTSPSRLKEYAASIGMYKPSPEVTIYAPKNILH